MMPAAAYGLVSIGLPWLGNLLGVGRRKAPDRDASHSRRPKAVSLRLGINRKKPRHDRSSDHNSIPVQIAGMVARGRFFSYRLADEPQRDPALSGMGGRDCPIQSILTDHVRNLSNSVARIRAAARSVTRH
jgi:hypothetical protein